MRNLLLCALLLGACGDDDGTTLDLDERRFSLQSGREVVAGTTPTLTFDEGQLTFYAGCNTSSGPYSVSAGKLTITDFASTNIGCDSERTAQDGFFTSFLAAKPAITLAGSTLTLTDSSATLVFSEAP